MTQHTSFTLAGVAHNTGIMDPNDYNTYGIVNGTHYTHDKWLQMALKILQDSRISLLNFILHVHWSSKNEFKTYQIHFFKNQSGKLTELLDYLFEDKHGQPTVLSWMEPWAIKLVSDKVAKEMDDIKVTLTWTINTITPENLLAWGVDTFIGLAVDNSALILGHLLHVATEVKRFEGEQ